MTSADLHILRSTFDIAALDPHGFLVDVRRRALKLDGFLLHAVPSMDRARSVVIFEAIGNALALFGGSAGAFRAPQELARRCHMPGITPRHYSVLGQALLDTLQARLGVAFTDQIRSVWAEAYIVFAEALMAQSYNAMELVA